MAVIRVVAVLLAAALLGGCGHDAPSANPSASPTPAWPKGHSYTSTAVTDGGRDKPLVAGTSIVVHFRDPGEVSVEAGCNELTVSGRLDGDRIVPKNFGATAKGCSAELLAQDAWIQHFFTDGPTLRLAGTVLTLTAGALQVRLADNADRPLLDTRWVVLKRIHNGTSTDVPVGVSYVIFSKTGLVGITGCSGLAANLTVHDGQMTVEPLHRSDVPCDGPVAELDAAIMATLTGTVGYRIAGADLTLSGPDGNALALRAQDAVGPTTSPQSTELPGAGPMSGMNGGMG
jgi:heat shock protein HslJ